MMIQINHFDGYKSLANLLSPHTFQRSLNIQDHEKGKSVLIEHQHISQEYDKECLFILIIVSI